MKRRAILRAAALAPLASAWPGLAVADDANAADLYRRACKALPARTEADRALLNAPMTAPLNDASSLLGRCGEALDLLVRGASAPRCDWGASWTGPDFFAEFDLFLIPGREFARIAALGVRVGVAAKHPERGMGVALAAMTFGRHLGRGAALILQLVGFAIEHLAIDGAAIALTALNRRNLAAIDRRVVALPATVSLAETIRAEKAFFLGCHVPGHRDEFDDAEIARQTAWYDRVAAACATPARLDAERDAAQSDPEAKRFFESFDAYRGARTFVDVKRALFRAGLAVAADGPEAIDAVSDPTDGHPFDLDAWEGGFELSSRFVPDRKPRASLVVGRGRAG